MSEEAMDPDDLEPDVPRSADEVAKRCLVLHAVVSVGNGESPVEMVAWLRREALWEDVSSEEKDYLGSVAPTRQQTFDATWRVEALATLLWAMGKCADPPFGRELCNLSSRRHSLPPLYGDTCAFVSGALTRAEDEIREFYESTYEAHWEVRDAHLNGRPAPDGINPGAIRERHHAFNWLIGYCGQDWDDVTTDT